ncbi:unnamed protein product [Rhizopus stolonifer]
MLIIVSIAGKKTTLHNGIKMKLIYRSQLQYNRKQHSKYLISLLNIMLSCSRRMVLFQLGGGKLWSLGKYQCSVRYSAICHFGTNALRRSDNEKRKPSLHAPAPKIPKVYRQSEPVALKSTEDQSYLLGSSSTIKRLTNIQLAVNSIIPKAFDRKAATNIDKNENLLSYIIEEF